MNLNPTRVFLAGLALLVLTGMTGPGCLTARAQDTAMPELAPVITREFRHTLLRNPTGGELTSLAREMAQPGKDARWLRDSLKHTREGYRIRSTRLALIRKTGLAAGIILAGLGLLLFGYTRRSPAPAPVARNVAIGLIVVLVGNGLLLNYALHYTATDSSLGYACEELQQPGHQEADSWGRMFAAAREFRTPRTENIYDHLLNQHGIKFLYPLTSLFLVDPIKTFNARSTLNWICFWIACLSAVLTARTFSFSLRQEFGVTSRFCLESAWLVLAFCFTLTFHPIILSLLLGQLQTVINTLFGGALLCYLTGRKALAGALLGLACGMKPQMGFFLLWGVIRKEKRLVVGLLATVAVLGLAALALYGWRENIAYLGPLSYLSKHSESYFANQTVNGLIQRFLFLGSNLRWSPTDYSPFNPWVYGGTLATSLAMVILSLAWRRPSGTVAPTHAAVDFAIAGLACTMAAPIAWFHHYGLLLPVFALALPLTLKLRDYAGLAFMGLAFVLVSNCFKATNLLADSRWNILQSYLFFGALLFFFLLLRLRWKLDRQARSPRLA